MSKENRGFTLIELLVVIAIISLLSSVIFASLNSARDRARAARIVQDFKQIETAFFLWADSENLAFWWEETLIPGGGGGINPRLQLMIDAGTLSPYLKEEPSPGVGNQYQYDRDNVDVYISCIVSTVGYGANIQLTQVNNAEIFNMVDDIIDNGDGVSCGRVRYIDVGGGNFSILYSLSADGRF